jgi:mannose-6-phosphate isomerase-like protein (cupin superfamily)
MAAYTHKNLESDVEDSAQKFGMGDVLEAHFARDALEANEFGLSLQRLRPGMRMPFGHRHAQQEEVYVIVEGNGRLKVDDEVLELALWDAVRVSPETARAFEAGDDGLTLLAFGAPNTGMGDAEQMPGWWD